LKSALCANQAVTDEISNLLANLDSSTFLVVFLQPLFAKLMLRLERMAYIHATLLPVLDSCTHTRDNSCVLHATWVTLTLNARRGQA
jgi:hypothetical protein